MAHQPTLPTGVIGPNDLFVCRIDDSPRMPPAHPRPVGAPVGVWLVLRNCPYCRDGAYCIRHWVGPRRPENPGAVAVDSRRAGVIR